MRIICIAFCIVCILLVDQCIAQEQQPLVPAFFIFGDSLVDVGNNNYIVTLAKANVAPYGIDSPMGPTGRFSNGKTVLDVVCELIGLPYIPPVLDPNTRGAMLLKGVNYASGAGGILDSSGQNYIQRISMWQQLRYFQSTLASINSQLGAASTSQLISQSLFAVVIGNNDYINNYLLSTTSTRLRYAPQAYQTIVLSTFANQLTELYRLGARKIAVSSIGPLGCIPSQLAQSSNGLCNDGVNKIIFDFNTGLHTMLDGLNANLPGSRFVYADTFAPVMKMVTNPEVYGFSIANKGCCGGGKFNGQYPCFLPRPISNMCADRDDYIFWDPFHPTQAANMILGKGLFESLKSSFGF